MYVCMHVCMQQSTASGEAYRIDQSGDAFVMSPPPGTALSVASRPSVRPSACSSVCDVPPIFSK